jgi:SAM-dependent methyltransferase
LDLLSHNDFALTGRALDVGSGPGPVADALKNRGASVIATDADPSHGVSAAALPFLPFRDCVFDVVTANFVVNHLDDPLAGVREMARVTRPGGRLAVSIWPAPAPPLQQLWYDVVAAAGLPATQRSATRDFRRTAEGLGGLFADAGLVDVATATVTWRHVADPDEWWIGAAYGLGSLGKALEGADGPTVARARREYDRIVAELGGIDLETSAVIAIGTRAG